MRLVLALSNREIFMTSTRLFSSVLTLDTSVYAAGDTLADLLEVTNAVVHEGGIGTIRALTVIDTNDQGQPFDLIFFNQSVDVGTKNSAWGVINANMSHALGIIRVESADFADLGSHRIATITRSQFGIKPQLGTSIFVGTISRGTGTYSSNGLRLILTIDRDR